MTNEELLSCAGVTTQSGMPMIVGTADIRRFAETVLKHFAPTSNMVTLQDLKDWDSRVLELIEKVYVNTDGYVLTILDALRDGEALRNLGIDSQDLVEGAYTRCLSVYGRSEDWYNSKTKAECLAWHAIHGTANVFNDDYTLVDDWYTIIINEKALMELGL